MASRLAAVTLSNARHWHRRLVDHCQKIGTGFFQNLSSPCFFVYMLSRPLRVFLSTCYHHAAILCTRIPVATRCILLVHYVARGHCTTTMLWCDCWSKSVNISGHLVTSAHNASCVEIWDRQRASTVQPTVCTCNADAWPGPWPHVPVSWLLAPICQTPLHCMLLHCC